MLGDIAVSDTTSGGKTERVVVRVVRDVLRIMGEVISVRGTRQAVDERRRVIGVQTFAVVDGCLQRLVRIVHL